MCNLLLKWWDRKRYLQALEIELLYDALYELCSSIDKMGNPNRLSGNASDALDDAKKILVAIKYERR